MKRLLLWVGAALVSTVLLLEFGLRAVGAGGFSTYDANDVIGYIPSANQSGRFMGRPWAFNERHMGVAQAFAPSPTRDVVLMGDSIVYGGNPYRQADKLGPVLESLSPGSEVWPIAAGSWALRNELTYLRTNPDVAAGADTFVFVLNSGDLAAPSVWVTDTTHPRKRPLWLTGYIIQRKLLPRERRAEPSDPGPPIAEWAAFRRATQAPVLIVLYPDLPETGAEGARFRAFEQRARNALSGPGVQIVSLLDAPGWGPQFYRDGIHATPEGLRFVAEWIKEKSGS